MSCGFLFGFTNVIIIIMTSTAFANDKEPWPPQFSDTIQSNFITQIQQGVSHKLARYSFCHCIAIQPKERKSWQQSSQQDHRHYQLNTSYVFCVFIWHALLILLGYIVLQLQLYMCSIMTSFISHILIIASQLAMQLVLWLLQHCISVFTVPNNEMMYRVYGGVPQNRRVLKSCTLLPKISARNQAPYYSISYFVNYRSFSTEAILIKLNSKSLVIKNYFSYINLNPFNLTSLNLVSYFSTIK